LPRRSAPPLDYVFIKEYIFNHMPNKELIKSMAPQKQNLYCEEDPTL